MNSKMAQVYLIGAGCDRGQLTLRGLEILQDADVVVYDDLIDPSVLYEVKKECKLIYVGKRSGKHSSSQEEINQILIEAAKGNRLVVRLKGGDPFVFGRGGEEVIALREAGISCEVLPGVCSGIAVPEHFGIPVTHRMLSRSVTMITGHTADDEPINYEALCKLNGTICFFMSVNKACEIGQGLMEAGMSKDMPVSILCSGYQERQKRITGKLGQMEQLAQNAHTPAIIVVGRVADFDLSSAFESPLKGISVTATGTKLFSGKLRQELSGAGAGVRQLPLIDIEPIFESIPEDFHQYDWLVFTSANGVRTFFEYLREKKTDLRRLSRVRFACIGEGSADELLRFGFKADFVPSEYTAACLGKELADMAGDSKILILRAQNGSEELTDILAKKEVKFKDCHIYKTNSLCGPDSSLSVDSDYIVFGSKAGVDTFFKNHRLSEATRIVCIGSNCQAGLKKYIKDENRILVSERHTVEDIVNLICEETLNTR